MNKQGQRNAKWAGWLLLSGIAMGMLSVAPAIDSENYLTDAATNFHSSVRGAVFQLMMSFTYVGFAILLYPLIKGVGRTLAVGFLSFRIMATLLSITGTVLLMSVLVLSQEFMQNPEQETVVFATVGNIFRTIRDSVNHVFMIITLCTGNLLLYVLLIRSRLLPRWISMLGIAGTFLSVMASMLVWFQLIHIVTIEYMALNALTAILDVILGVWLITKGIRFDQMEKNVTFDK